MIEKKMETAIMWFILGLGFRVGGNIRITLGLYWGPIGGNIGIMENQMEKTMEDKIETGVM